MHSEDGCRSRWPWTPLLDHFARPPSGNAQRSKGARLLCVPLFVHAPLDVECVQRTLDPDRRPAPGRAWHREPAQTRDASPHARPLAPSGCSSIGGALRSLAERGEGAAGCSGAPGSRRAVRHGGTSASNGRRRSRGTMNMAPVMRRLPRKRVSERLWRRSAIPPPATTRCGIRSDTSREVEGLGPEPSKANSSRESAVVANRPDIS